MDHERMTYRIEQVEERHIARIRQFNERMRNAGSRWQFYDKVVPLWLAPAPGATAWREFYLAVDEDDTVRGGFGIKFENFLLRGRSMQFGWLQGPVAESAIDPSLKGLGRLMITDCLRRAPLQISWGANSLAAPSAGTCSMQIRFIDPDRALLNIRELQSNRYGKIVRNHRALRRLAGTALKLYQSLRAGSSMSNGVPGYHVEPEFGDWADAIWQKSRGTYGLIALRDRDALNRAMPQSGYPEAIVLRVTHRDEDIGWAAVRIRHLADDPQFGNCVSGSIIDALAIAGHEKDVIRAATHFLQTKTCDLVGACFLHPRWQGALRDCGYLFVPGRRNIGFSEQLTAIEPDRSWLLSNTHLTLIDSDGPRIF